MNQAPEPEWPNKDDSWVVVEPAPKPKPKAG